MSVLCDSLFQSYSSPLHLFPVFNSFSFLTRLLSHSVSSAARDHFDPDFLDYSRVQTTQTKHRCTLYPLRLAVTPPTLMKAVMTSPTRAGTKTRALPRDSLESSAHRGPRQRSHPSRTDARSPTISSSSCLRRRIRKRKNLRMKMTRFEMDDHQARRFNFEHVHGFVRTPLPPPLLKKISNESLLGQSKNVGIISPYPLFNSLDEPSDEKPLFPDDEQSVCGAEAELEHAEEPRMPNASPVDVDENANSDSSPSERGDDTLGCSSRQKPNKWPRHARKNQSFRPERHPGLHPRTRRRVRSFRGQHDLVFTGRWSGEDLLRRKQREPYKQVSRRELVWRRKRWSQHFVIVGH